MVGNAKYLIYGSASSNCLSIHSGSSIIHCDLNPKKNRLTLLVFRNYTREIVRRDSGNLTLNATPEILALRLAVIDKEAPPAVLADLVEELRDCWVEDHYGAEEVLAKLRECW